LAFPDGWLIPQGYLRRGLDFVHVNEAAGNGVLIMCAAGVSRSATFTLAYLVERGYDLQDAFLHLRECRPIVSPHPSLWISLLEFFDEPYSLNDVLSWR
jgi:protein-tyrosine phosphatase